MSNPTAGFAPDEIRTDMSTRDARLKWVIVVDGALPAGQIVNAAACVATATSRAVEGLLGPGAVDADGMGHVGLPWAGCTILTAPAQALGQVRAKAGTRDDLFVADMPLAAQETRIYDEFLQRLAAETSEQIGYAAVSIVGPRNRVDRIVGSLGLLP